MVKYAPAKINAAFRSFIFPWWIISVASSAWIGIDTIPNEMWADEGEATMDWPCVIMVVWYACMVMLGMMSLCIDTERLPQDNYRRHLLNSRYNKPIAEITARLDENTGSIAIYKAQSDITGKSLDFMRTFTPDEHEKIHEYVAEQRDKLKGPDLTEAQAIVKAING